jgi:phosphatidate phosphatase PAH1
MHRLLVTASVVPSAPILVTLMKEALSSSETSVLTRATPRNIPEDTILHSHLHGNLKSYKIRNVLCLFLNLCLHSEKNNLVHHIEAEGCTNSTELLVFFENLETCRTKSSELELFVLLYKICSTNFCSHKRSAIYTPSNSSDADITLCKVCYFH